MVLRAKEAGDFHSPYSSVASDPLPTPDLAPVHATYFAPATSHASASAPDPVNDHTTASDFAPASAPTPGNDPTTASAPGKLEFAGQ